MFREDFAWGVASSAYQIEGRDKEDGCGKNIWDTFTEEGRVYENQNAYVSCDEIHRYKEDFALMRLLGIRAYRFSLSWARILPEGTGRVNEKAIALYRDMILEMKKNGITPYITLYHWEFPQALQDRGGWLNEDVIGWFGEYAKVVAENFSDLCEYFFTLNEPQCFVGLGHLSGVIRRPTAKRISKRQRKFISDFITRSITGHGMWHGFPIRCSSEVIRRKDWKNIRSICPRSQRKIWN